MADYRDSIEKFLTEEEWRDEFIAGLYLSNNNLETFLTKYKEKVLEYNTMAQLVFVFIWLKKTNLPIESLNISLLRNYLKHSRIQSESVSSLVTGSKKRYNNETKKILKMADICFGEDSNEYNEWLRSSIKELSTKMLSFIVEEESILSVLNNLNISPKNFCNFIILKKSRKLLSENKGSEFYNLIEKTFDRKKEKIKSIDELAYFSYINDFKSEYLTESEKYEMFSLYMSELDICFKNLTLEKEDIDYNLFNVSLKNLSGEDKRKAELVYSLRDKINVFYLLLNKKIWQKAIESYIEKESYKIDKSRIEGLDKLMFYAERNNYYTIKERTKNIEVDVFIKYAKDLSVLKLKRSSMIDVYKEELAKPKTFIKYLSNINDREGMEELKNKLFPDESISKETTRNNKHYPAYLYNTSFLRYLPLEVVLFLNAEFKHYLVNIPSSIANEKDHVYWSITARNLFTDLFIRLDEDLNLSESGKEELYLLYKK